MDKHKYVDEFEINASPKVIYPYLNSPANLSEWFAAEVKMERGKIFNFVWDDENHYAHLVASRMNKQVRFEFLNAEKEKERNPAYLDFRLQESELTNTTFLRITDYSEMTETEDLQDLWKGLVNNLKEVIGA